MVNSMKIFVTGHRGFIGAHLVDVLKQEGHTVVGCDLKLFEGCNWEPLVEPDRELTKDIRTIEAPDLDGCDCVMHLAASSMPNSPSTSTGTPRSAWQGRPSRPGCRASSLPGAARSTARERILTWM